MQKPWSNPGSSWRKNDRGSRFSSHSSPSSSGPSIETSSSARALGLLSRRSAGSTNQTVGQHMSEIMPEDSPIVVALKRALQGESGNVVQEYRGRIFRAHIEPIRHSARNEVVGAIGLAIDIDEEIRAQSRASRKDAYTREALRPVDQRSGRRERTDRS